MSPRDLLARSALEVAPALLGWTFTHVTPEGRVSVVITEVEAYLGSEDPASHAFNGPTGRNAVMFGEAGHLYTYLSYGMHWCSNVVTGEPGAASAVLLRAGRVVEGTEVAQRRRGPNVREAALARGPGCLGQALGLDARHNGADLVDGKNPTLEPALPIGATEVASGPRVGVRLAHDVAWRFWLAGDPSVSAYRRHPKAAPA